VSDIWFAPTRLEFQSVPVRGGSSWTTMELADASGLFGTAETILEWQGRSVTAEIARLGSRLRGVRLTSERDVIDILGLLEADLAADFFMANVASALRGAVVDALARRAGLPLHAYLRDESPPTGVAPPAVVLYANINRALFPDDAGNSDRSPAAFAVVARRAEQRGFRAVKCAPFDECSPPYPTSRTGLHACAAAGLARVRAIREAVGPEVAVYVDCHRRFDLATSLALAEALDAIGVTWFEEALDPLVSPAEMRQITAATSMPVAGGELGYGLIGFARIINEAAVDIIMPDVMFCGGPAEAHRMGLELEATHPNSVSLHCPAGPIALLASAHATAAIGGSRPLEHAVDEVPWRHEVLEVREQVVDGAIHIPVGSGLGTRVDRGFVERQGGRRWAE